MRRPLALTLTLLVALGCKPGAPPQPADHPPPADPPPIRQPPPTLPLPPGRPSPRNSRSTARGSSCQRRSSSTPTAPLSTPPPTLPSTTCSTTSAPRESVSLVRIEGHASDQALSEARALAVTRWLVVRGVACERLVPVGFGPTKPVADASTPRVAPPTCASTRSMQPYAAASSAACPPTAAASSWRPLPLSAPGPARSAAPTSIAIPGPTCRLSSTARSDRAITPGRRRQLRSRSAPRADAIRRAAPQQGARARGPHGRRSRARR
ncbi:MAG: OmpA family protein [Nannocystis sp.]|nr:OmpA family protein [Nannocystis sp.]